MRPAFTLVEVLVALVLLEFGLLGLVATSAVAARDLATARASARARALARNRVELLRSSACRGPASGAVVAPGGVVEVWWIAGDTLGREIADSVSYPLPTGHRAHMVLRAWALCSV